MGLVGILYWVYAVKHVGHFVHQRSVGNDAPTNCSTISETVDF